MYSTPEKFPANGASAGPACITKGFGPRHEM